eukprot:TRINITY_DN32705_c0_g1_i1.p1 TRINITY_DN32705_c0_g1~~TRINITY_DN32705_c0_g1_i1.p1  ORF type:complete len:164 (-),score=2.92 TRINITY_DN32705_c0_g1_i1:152-643(-)
MRRWSMGILLFDYSHYDLGLACDLNVTNNNKNIITLIAVQSQQKDQTNQSQYKLQQNQLIQIVSQKFYLVINRILISRNYQQQFEIRSLSSVFKPYQFTQIHKESFQKQITAKNNIMSTKRQQNKNQTTTKIFSKSLLRNLIKLKNYNTLKTTSYFTPQKSFL